MRSDKTKKHPLSSIYTDNHREKIKDAGVVTVVAKLEPKDLEYLGRIMKTLGLSRSDAVRHAIRHTVRKL